MPQQRGVFAKEMFRPWARRRRLRKQFNVRHLEDQGDTEFIERAAPRVSSEQRALILLVRRMIAERSGVGSSQVYAEDLTTELDALMGQSSLFDFILAVPDGLDPVTFLQDFEDLATRLVHRQMKIPSAVAEGLVQEWEHGFSVGKWCAKLVETASGKTASMSG